MRFSRAVLGPSPRVCPRAFCSASSSAAGDVSGIAWLGDCNLHPVESDAARLGQRDLVSGEASRSPADDASIRASHLREISVTPQFPKPSGDGYLGDLE